MVIELVTLAVAALDSVREGVRFVQDQKGQAVDLRLTVKQVIQGKESVLAFGRVTNNADTPVTVTEINLILDGLRAGRAPLLALTNVGGDTLKVDSHIESELYEVSGLADLRILDSDLYLQHNESRTGWMFFPVPRQNVEELEEVQVELCIGADLYIRERLTHFRDPRRLID